MFDDDPCHPILERSWQYEIVGLSYHRDLNSPADSFLDLNLQKGSLRRRLRFLDPQDLQITAGFPNSSGLCILDVSRRQLEGIKILVDNREGHGGCPTFWARQVVDLDITEAV